ncbi:MAG: SIR2 family protein [Fimbriimonadaceae bacterium]
MQIVSCGPDVPTAMLRAQEQGRLVFFCGAGISCAAGLPGFKQLIKSVYCRLGTARSEPESRLCRQGRYDEALEALERRLPGGRSELRRAVAKILAAIEPRPEKLGAHAALLKLARRSDGGMQLVTTNFDRLFHAASNMAGCAFSEFAAPALPVPRWTGWDGVVYLHGLLAENPTHADLDQLVLTSGDFGRAYLTEGWAARFVGELLRGFHVCFVGYSMGDSVVRYVMDAMAVDWREESGLPPAWAFVGGNPALGAVCFGDGEQHLGKGDSFLNDAAAIDQTSPTVWSMPFIGERMAAGVVRHAPPGLGAGGSRRRSTVCPNEATTPRQVNTIATARIKGGTTCLVGPTAIRANVVVKTMLVPRQNHRLFRRQGACMSARWQTPVRMRRLRTPVSLLVAAAVSQAPHSGPEAKISQTAKISSTPPAACRAILKRLCPSHMARYLLVTCHPGRAQA